MLAKGSALRAMFVDSAPDNVLIEPKGSLLALLATGAGLGALSKSPKSMRSATGAAATAGAFATACLTGNCIDGLV